MSIQLYDLVGADASRPFSPHCWKVKMAAVHKGLAVESIPVTFAAIKDIENGGFTKVPVIRHGKKLVEDSHSIALYLSQAYPETPKRIFNGEGAKHITKFVESWSQTQLHPWIAKWALMDIYNMLDEESKPYFRSSREAMFKKTLEEVVADREERISDLGAILLPLKFMLKSQPFIGGSEPKFADYVVFGAFQWLRVCSGLHMMDKDDPVLDWVNRMLDLHDGLGRSVGEANA